MVNRTINPVIDVTGMTNLYTIVKGESIFMKRVVLLFGICFSVLSVFAEDNVLQTIEIEPVKDTYNIVLVSDKACDVKKTVQASNKIDLVLKDIRASKTLNTVYNNVSNVDTVMIEPQGNGIKIFFQADNAQASTISFDTIAPVMPAQPKSTEKKLKLNNPIESYAPIYNEDFEQSKTNTLFNKLKTSQAVSGIKDSFDEEGASESANKFISWGLIGLLVFATARLFKRREPEMKIGLAQQLNENPDFGMMQNLPSSGFNNYQSVAKPFTTVNYGLNAYRNENRNPYETEPMQFHNPRLNKYAAQPQPVPAQPVKKPVHAQSATATVAQKPAEDMSSSQTKQSNPNIDNLKFLESMTAIYEKSGRYDLARGLKQSLSKNNIK